MVPRDIWLWPAVAALENQMLEWMYMHTYTYGGPHYIPHVNYQWRGIIRIDTGYSATKDSQNWWIGSLAVQHWEQPWLILMVVTRQTYPLDWPVSLSLAMFICLASWKCFPRLSSVVSRDIYLMNNVLSTGSVDQNKTFTCSTKNLIRYHWKTYKIWFV